MVQISTRVLVAALAAAPALAIPLSQPVAGDVATREIEVELDARQPFLGHIFRKVGSVLGITKEKEVEGRDFADEMLDIDARDYDEAVADLEARNPFLGKLFKVAKGFLGFRRDVDELDARDIEDELLEARDLIDEVDIRELDEFVGDLEARNPFLGKLFKVAKGFLGFRREVDHEDIISREFDDAVVELEARNPFLGKLFKVAKGFLGFRRDVDELDARDLEDELLEARDLLDEVDIRELDEFVGDLEARNPFLGKLFKVAKGFLGFRRESDSDFEAREYDIEEFDARDFDFEELDARDFFDFEDFEAREIDELD